MKCPKIYKIVQTTRERALLNESEISIGTDRTLTEVQDFGECYKENCAYWNKEKERCIGG